VRISAREIEESQKMRIAMIVKPVDPYSDDVQGIEEILKAEHTECHELKQFPEGEQKTRILHINHGKSSVD
jgi:hypothetical protein